jgi:hypothetical protein
MDGRPRSCPGASKSLKGVEHWVTILDVRSTRLGSIHRSHRVLGLPSRLDPGILYRSPERLRDMNKKTIIPASGDVEKYSVPDGKFTCPICGMRYNVKTYAEHCCFKIARRAPSLRT